MRSGAFIFGAGIIGVALHHAQLVDGRRPRGHDERPPYPRRPAPPPLRHDHVHRLRGDVLRGVVLGLFRRGALSPTTRCSIQRVEVLGGVWPPKGIETFDPWHLPLLNTLILLTSGHHGDLGAPRAARERPPGPEGRPVADHRPRRAVHLRAGLRVQPRRLRLQRQHLRRDLLHGDGLPRRARDHRDDLPGRLPAAGPIAAISRRSSISASSSPPGTGTSSTWSGSSCSPAIYVWGYGGHAAAGH